MKKQNELFSTKGFYLGVFIFLLGIIVMIARISIDLKNLKNQNTTNIVSQEKQISDKIVSLQTKLDEKINEQISIKNEDTSNKKPTIKITVFDHNPIKNKTGLITAIEFIDLNDQKDRDDAQFVNTILEYNKNIRLISKLNNKSENKELHIANLAAIVASENNHFFEFKNKLIKNNKHNMDYIITSLEKSGIDLRLFRKNIENNADVILRKLSQDINQAQSLKINNYTIVINGVIFSDNLKSKNKLKDIPTFLEKFESNY